MTFGEFLKKYFTNCNRLLFYVSPTSKFKGKDYETSNFDYDVVSLSETTSLVLLTNSNTYYFHLSETIEITEDKTAIIFANGLTMKISKIEDVLYT